MNERITASPDASESSEIDAVVPVGSEHGTLYRLLRTPGGAIGFSLLGLIVAGIVIIPELLSSDPTTMNLIDRLQPPSGLHLLGTDAFGRDVLVRILYGGRFSLMIGIVSVGLAGLVGATIGSISGYGRGVVDQVLMRVMDALISFPAVLLAMAIIAVLGTGLVNLMVAIAIATVPAFARVMRGAVLQVREHDYITTSQTIGAHPLRILLSHVIPNSVAPVVVLATLQIAAAILAASSLSFLGLGIQPPTPEWGSMLAEGRSFLNQAPWMLLAPGGAVVLTVMGFNLVGDALRDVLDPTLRRRD